MEKRGPRFTLTPFKKAVFPQNFLSADVEKPRFSPRSPLFLNGGLVKPPDPSCRDIPLG